MRVLTRVAVSSLLWIPALAFGDAFSEFRIPEHSWYSASANFGGDVRPALFRSDDREARSTSFTGNLAGFASWALDGDRRQHALAVGVHTDGRSEHRTDSEAFRGGDYSQSSSSDSRFRDVSEGWLLSGELRRYFWGSPVGLIVRGAGGANYGQAWSKFRRESAQRTGSSSYRFEGSEGGVTWEYSYAADGGGSAGYGRVRDASGVYLAFLLEQRLREVGALSGPLSAAAREKLASLYYIRPRFRYVHERPSRFFWREVEKILREDKALGDQGLDAYGVFRADEPYAFLAARTPGLRRLAGYYAGFTVLGSHQHSILRLTRDEMRVDVRDDTLYSSSRFVGARRLANSQDLALVGGEAEVHRPIGMRWQIDMSGRILFPTNTSVPHGIDVASGAAIGYLVADRWTVNGFADQSRVVADAPPGIPRRDTWSADYGVALGYYVEDRVQLSLSAAETQAGENPGGYSTGRAYRRSGAVSFGISYHFLGALDARGLFEPLRLAPPSLVTY